MTKEEAFETLGIGTDATVNDATKAYHELSKNMHPDTSKDGSVDGQARLNEAHEVVVASLQTSFNGALVPIEVKQAVQVLERGIARQTASRECDAFVKRVTNSRTRPIQNFKYMAFLMASFAAFLGWLSNDVGFGDNFSPEMLKITKQMALMLAAAGGVTHFLVQHQTHVIERFKDRMSDEDRCADFLLASGIELERSFTLRDLLKKETDSNEHSPSVLRGFLPLSRKECIELALLKGLEIGIIENVADSRRRYQVAADARLLFN